MREEQDIVRGEALKLQVRAETSRHRARERRPNRSKDQVRTRRLHATLAVAYSEVLTATADSIVTVATRAGLKALGLDHLLEATLRYVHISPNWAYLLRAEVKKVQAQLLKLDEAHLREGKRKRCNTKKHIFGHGIKGVRRVMNKHGTVTGLQQVDHSCPIGLHWEVSPLELSRHNIKAEMHEWTSSLPRDKYEVSLTDTYIKIRANILTDDPALLTWAPKYPSPFTSLPTLKYSTGPWTKDNLVTAVEFFFSAMPITPSPSVAILRNIATRFRLPRLYRTRLERIMPTVECSITAHINRVPAWTRTVFVPTGKR